MSNIQYPNQVITLYEGTLVGYHRLLDDDNQRWSIIAVNDNKVAFQNPPTGIYAKVDSEYQGAQVVGGASPYILQLISVPGGASQIATADGSYVWRLTSGNDNAPIQLQETPYDGADAQWDLGVATRVE